MTRLGMSWVGPVALAFLLAPALGRAQSEDLPHFQEVLRLLRANLPGVTDDELNRAAVQGLLEGFRPRVELVTNAAAATPAATAGISRSTVYEQAFGYVRIPQVTAGLSEAFGAALDQLRSGQKLKGLVVDLRFADGHDYQAAAGLADRFLSKEQPLLDWGESSARSTAKSEALDLPLAVLINRQTAGAAEALAELLRTTRVALLVGSPTAGQAYTFREFALDSGARLRIAGAPVRVGADLVLTNRVAPDIAVDVPPDRETAYYADPYKVFADAAGTTDVSVAGLMARATRTARTARLNEAELVRRQRDQDSPDEPPPASARPEAAPAEKTLQDAALVRALDLLKGIAVVERTGRS